MAGLRAGLNLGPRPGPSINGLGLGLGPGSGSGSGRAGPKAGRGLFGGPYIGLPLIIDNSLLEGTIIVLDPRGSKNLLHHTSPLWFVLPFRLTD